MRGFGADDSGLQGIALRGRQVLFSVIAEYIATGRPVGSRTVSRKYGLELSPATIRNVLSDLENAGYLHQPHTSAGRVPTDIALRAFIAALTEFPEIPESQQREMRQRIRAIFQKEPRAGEHGSLRQAGSMLSELSGAAAVVTASPIDRRPLAQLRFIVTKPEQLLAVIVFKDGMVENRYIRVTQQPTVSELERVHNLLADVVEGRTLGALREMFASRLANEKVEVDQLRAQAFELGSEALKRAPSRAEAVVIEGRSRLMELPEYGDADRVRALVRTLEDREHLVGLLDMTMDAGIVTVYLGSETDAAGDGEISLVAAPYGTEGKVSGTVGVIGPMRMDYARMMPLVEATAEAMTEVLKKKD